MDSRKKIVVTGSAGLLGWHTSARLHAANCAARFRGEEEPFNLILADRATFQDPARLANAIDGADVILHFAGVNRGTDDEVADGNPSIARELAEAVRGNNHRPHIVYANSTHSRLDTPYGQSKREAGRILGDAAEVSNLIFPHIFGECARPDYNNVTATLIDRLWKGEQPEIQPGASVNLLHAGEAANLAIEAGSGKRSGEITPASRAMTVAELWDRLRAFHVDYRANVFPALDDDFDLRLFNCYRTGGFPAHYPLTLSARNDVRGMLVETAKARGESQTFVSTTLPGQSRGDHFHISLVERFLVVAGDATIRIRRVLTDHVHEFVVSGDQPRAIDMPPLHTHHIVNNGPREVVTFFWAHRLFNPSEPDTFADPVIQADQLA